MTAVTPTSRNSLSKKRASRGALIALALVIAASGALFIMTRNVVSQNNGGTTEGTPTAEELEGLRDQAIADGVDQLELEFVEYNDSGVEGTVTLYDLDDRTLVAILIEEGGDVHPGHIHTGTCDDLDPLPFAPLSNVRNEEDSLSLVETPLRELIDDDYAVDLHLSPNELGTLIVCTDIEGEPTPATPVAGATPGTPGATVAATEQPEPTSAPVATQSLVTQTPQPTATHAPAETAVPTEAPATLTPTAEPSPTEAATPDDSSQDGTGGAQAAPGSVASLPLTDFSGLGVTGTIALIALDEDTTKLTIRLNGDAVTGGHIAHLHPGTCDDPRDEGTIYLATVDANGTSDTTVGLSISTLLNEAWVVNVHQSDADYDTWLVCGFLGNATLGMTGLQDVTPVAGGQTAPVSGKGEPLTGNDGTSGVGGQDDDRQATTLPQTAGVGSSVPWPESPTESIIWALSSFAMMLAAFAVVIRRAERANRQPPRWNRLEI